jgi:YggT family protein
MFIFSNLLMAVATVLGMLLRVYLWIIIIRAVISWVNPDPYNPIVRFLYAATDPVLYRVRRAVPAFFSGIDFSPILVIAAIYFLEVFLVQSLIDLAQQIR